MNIILQKVTTKRSVPKDHSADMIQEVCSLFFVCDYQVCTFVCVFVGSWLATKVFIGDLPATESGQVIIK